mgnify:CR=1 FL=1
MKRDFTATCHVICDDKVLLIYHKKFKKWLPPGGHMEANETPAEAAKREVFEETGLLVEFISQDTINISNSNAKSIGPICASWKKFLPMEIFQPISISILFF